MSGHDTECIRYSSDGSTVHRGIHEWRLIEAKIHYRRPTAEEFEKALIEAENYPTVFKTEQERINEAKRGIHTTDYECRWYCVHCRRFEMTLVSNEDMAFRLADDEVRL